MLFFERFSKRGSLVSYYFFETRLLNILLWDGLHRLHFFYPLFKGLGAWDVFWSIFGFHCWSSWFFWLFVSLFGIEVDPSMNHFAERKVSIGLRMGCFTIDSVQYMSKAAYSRLTNTNHFSLFIINCDYSYIPIQEISMIHIWIHYQSSSLNTILVLCSNCLNCLREMYSSECGIWTG